MHYQQLQEFKESWSSCTDNLEAPVAKPDIDDDGDEEKETKPAMGNAGDAAAGDAFAKVGGAAATKAKVAITKVMAEGKASGVAPTEKNADATVVVRRRAT